jgi:hypothetical protein
MLMVYAIIDGSFVEMSIWCFDREWWFLAYIGMTTCGYVNTYMHIY